MKDNTQRPSPSSPNLQAETHLKAGEGLDVTACSASSFVTTAFASKFRNNIITLLRDLNYDNANARFRKENGGVKPCHEFPCDENTADSLRNELRNLLNRIPEPTLAMDLA